MRARPLIRAFAGLVAWAVRLVPAAALGALLFAFDGGMRWLGLVGLPLLILALRRDGPGCGAGGCGPGAGRATSAWPAP